MKLHRLDRSNGDYLWWIVTSLVLQARAAGACMARNSTFNLRQITRKQCHEHTCDVEPSQRFCMTAQC